MILATFIFWDIAEFKTVMIVCLYVCLFVDEKNPTKIKFSIIVYHFHFSLQLQCDGMYVRVWSEIRGKIIPLNGIHPQEYELVAVLLGCFFLCLFTSVESFYGVPLLFSKNLSNVCCVCLHCIVFQKCNIAVSLRMFTALFECSLSG